LFEEKKFTEMHQIILNDNGVSKLQEKMEEFSAFVEHIVKRNKNIVKEEKSKEIINKKVVDLNSRRKVLKRRR
jgi:16S rRNA G527 N7-methylase RsmG